MSEDESLRDRFVKERDQWIERTLEVLKILVKSRKDIDEHFRGRFMFNPKFFTCKCDIPRGWFWEWAWGAVCKVSVPHPIAQINSVRFSTISTMETNLKIGEALCLEVTCLSCGSKMMITRKCVSSGWIQADCPGRIDCLTSDIRELGQPEFEKFLLGFQLPVRWIWASD